MKLQTLVAGIIVALADAEIKSTLTEAECLKVCLRRFKQTPRALNVVVCKKVCKKKEKIPQGGLCETNKDCKCGYTDPIFGPIECGCSVPYDPSNNLFDKPGSTCDPLQAVCCSQGSPLAPKVCASPIKNGQPQCAFGVLIPN